MVNPMHEFFQQLEQVCHVPRRVALATLVNTLGTSPRQEGAKMWVDESGTILGAVTIGGCVDGHVIAHAEAVLAAQEARLIALPLGDEEAWELGLSCAGTIEVFIEPLDTVHAHTLTLYSALKAHLDSGGEAGALVTCLDGASIGAKLLLLDNGHSLGALGDVQLQQAVCQAVLPHMTQGRSRAITLALPPQTTRVFVEVHTPPATLVFVGANQVAMVLAQLARPLGFHTIVVDSRPRFATPERFPTVDTLLEGIPSDLVKTLPLSTGTAIVLVTHDYKYDLPILRYVLSSPAYYVGVLGSRQRGEGLRQFLREAGVAEAALQRMRVPIGLDLGGRSAAEIALAILAEVVSSRYHSSTLPLSRQS